MEGCKNWVARKGLCATHYKRGREYVIGDYQGARPDAPAVLYLIRNDILWKIGYALVHRRSLRLNQHRWHTEILDERYGQLADVRRAEAAVKEFMRLRGISHLQEEQDGFTETYYRGDGGIDPVSLDRLLEDVQFQWVPR